MYEAIVSDKSRRMRNNVHADGHTLGITLKGRHTAYDGWRPWHPLPAKRMCARVRQLGIADLKQADNAKGRKRGQGGRRKGGQTLHFPRTNRIYMDAMTVIVVMIEAKMMASSPDSVAVSNSCKVTRHGNNGRERRHRANDLGRKRYERAC